MFDAEYSESGLEGHFGSSPLARYETTPSSTVPTRRKQRAESKADPNPRERRKQPKPPTEDDKAPQEDKPATEEKQTPSGDKAQQDKGKEDQRGFLRRHPLLTVVIGVGAAFVAVCGYVWYDYQSHFESTDDAFIASRQTAIAPQVTGYVVSVPVTDNQHVNAGDVIATLDPRDYQVALDQANAQIASAKASIANVEAQTDVQHAQIDAGKAQVAQAQATLTFAEEQASRYQQLARTGAGSVQNAQQYTSQLGQQDAALKSAEATEHVAERQLAALKAQMQSADASLETADAQREQALLNLSYTKVTASVPGRVVNLTAEPGEFAQPGTNLTMFVPDEIWIVANYKETQLDLMRPGQPVTFAIDAYPEREFHGHVASVQPGSGTAFSLLPAQNATGNYVKVVQRVPVKIIIDHAPPDVALGPGMSVDPTVRVDPSPSIWENLTAAFDRDYARYQVYYERFRSRL